MNIRELRPYILKVLIEHEGDLLIHPSIIIDDLIEQLSLDVLVQIGIHGNYLVTEDYEAVWHHYILPTLANPRFNVKVFARD